MFLAEAPVEDTEEEAPFVHRLFPCLTEANNGRAAHTAVVKARDDARMRAVLDATHAMRRYPAPTMSIFGLGATIFDLSDYSLPGRNCTVDSRMPYWPGCYLVSDRPDMMGLRYAGESLCIRERIASHFIQNDNLTSWFREGVFLVILETFEDKIPTKSFLRLRERLWIDATQADKNAKYLSAITDSREEQVRKGGTERTSKRSIERASKKRRSRSS